MSGIKNKFARAIAPIMVLGASFSATAAEANDASPNTTSSISTSVKKPNTAPSVEEQLALLGENYDYDKARRYTVGKKYIFPEHRYPTITEKKVGYRASTGITVIWMNENDVRMDAMIDNLIRDGYDIQIAIGAPEGTAYAFINRRGFIEFEGDYGEFAGLTEGSINRNIGKPAMTTSLAHNNKPEHNLN